MTTGDHIETIQAYDLLIGLTASSDIKNAANGMNKLLLQIGDHVRGIEDGIKHQSHRLALKHTASN
jgi:hypothetical protein